MRRAPEILLTKAQIEELLGCPVDRVERVPGGLVNTIYRVETRGETLTLRLFSRGQAACAIERALLTRLAGSIPVPELLRAGPSFVVTRWVEGMTLNEFRRASAPDALLALAGHLGALAARVASFDASGLENGRTDSAAFIAGACRQLERGPARERLGSGLADSLVALYAGFEIPAAETLAHGDFGGRNILISPEGRIAAVIDWEDAFAGSPLWDVGSLFRYAGRFREPFRAHFEVGYREAGGILGENWWTAARLLDAARQIETIDSPAAQPEVVAEVTELLSIVASAG